MRARQPNTSKRVQTMGWRGEVDVCKKGAGRQQRGPLRSNRVASLCQHLPGILGRVLTVPATRSHIKNSAVNPVCN